MAIMASPDMTAVMQMMQSMGLDVMGGEAFIQPTSAHDTPAVKQMTRVMCKELTVRALQHQPAMAPEWFSSTCEAIDDALAEGPNPVYVGLDAAAETYALFGRLDRALVEFLLDITNRTDEMVAIVNDGDDVALALNDQSEAFSQSFFNVVDEFQKLSHYISKMPFIVDLSKAIHIVRRQIENSTSIRDLKVLSDSLTATNNRATSADAPPFRCSVVPVDCADTAE
jgi:hypothetical protein